MASSVSARASKPGSVGVTDNIVADDINELGGALIGYDVETGSLTIGAGAATIMTVTVVLPVARILKIEAEINISCTTTAGQFQCTIQMAVGAGSPTSIGRRDFGYQALAASTPLAASAACLAFLSAGTYTFTCVAGRSGTDTNTWTGTGSATSPCELRVFDVGPQF